MIKIDDHILLEPINEGHATALFSLVDSNREYLREWLPWVDNMRSVENFNNHIAYCRRCEAEGTDFAYMIMLNNEMIGRIGIHYIHQYNQTASIGYWLANNYQGKGIMTKACIALIDHCFNAFGMNRVEIKCATGNHKSQAIPERLKFVKEGILRKAELVNGEFLDIYLYSMLKEEWANRS